MNGSHRLIILTAWKADLSQGSTCQYVTSKLELQRRLCSCLQSAYPPSGGLTASIVAKAYFLEQISLSICVSYWSCFSGEHWWLSTQIYNAGQRWRVWIKMRMKIRAETKQKLLVNSRQMNWKRNAKWHKENTEEQQMTWSPASRADTNHACPFDRSIDGGSFSKHKSKWQPDIRNCWINREPNPVVLWLINNDRRLKLLVMVSKAVRGRGTCKLQIWIREMQNRETR